MNQKLSIIESLFDFSSDIRYVALYTDKDLMFRQRQKKPDSSSAETDRYEELLVNPALLNLARQRGNLDCGGLRFLIVGYGNFYQLIKEIKEGHLSICLNKNSDITRLPDRIFDYLKEEYPDLFFEEELNYRAQRRG